MKMVASCLLQLFLDRHAASPVLHLAQGSLTVLPAATPPSLLLPPVKGSTSSCSRVPCTASSAVGAGSQIEGNGCWLLLLTS